jgi:hypothetical protein
VDGIQHKPDGQAHRQTKQKDQIAEPGNQQATPFVQYEHR